MPIRPRTPLRTAQPGLLKHWTLWVWFVAALILCVGGVFLWKSGRWLVREDVFEKAGWGVVLAGESRDCERSDAAIRMFQEGKLDTLVISATRTFKTRYNSEFMVDYYVQQGVPRDRVFEFRQDAYSTIEEARLLIRQFRLQNLDTAVIITTTFHTARTRRIFRKLAGGYPVVLVAAAEYNVYDPGAFWSNRESLKLWFDEWAKTFFTVFELARTGPETDKAQYQGLTPDIRTSHASAASPLSVDSAGVDSVAQPPDAEADSAGDSSSAAQANAAALAVAADSVKAGAAGALDGKREAKAALDSAAKADSVKSRKDSIKAHKDSVKAKAALDKAAAAAKEAEKKAEARLASEAKAEVKDGAKAKAAARDADAKKQLPRAAKKLPAAKESGKAADKKLEKTRLKKP